MKRIRKQVIENVGAFEYYLTETRVPYDEKTVTTYGVAIMDVNENYVEEVSDIWTEKDKVVDFIKLLADNQVTCTHLYQLCEEFTEELYSI